MQNLKQAKTSVAKIIKNYIGDRDDEIT